MNYLKSYLYQYDDSKKRFIKNLIQKVFYFKSGLELPDNLHEVIYSLKPVFYLLGTVILKEQDEVKNLMFVENGVAEVYTEFEGNEFIIDRLYRGSIINYRTFIM